MSDGLKRRDFLKVVGAGSAGATLSGCSTGEVERLIPYVVPPEDITPGVATWYNTVSGECGSGIRVKTREGRATMIEGNPDHPLSRGSVSTQAIATLQELYSPDRYAYPMLRTGGQLQRVSWEEAEAALVARLGEGGRTLLLTSPSGPAQEQLLDQFAASVRGDRFVWDGLNDSALREATRIAFGYNAMPRYDVANAGMIVSFGADFLETFGSSVEYSNGFQSAHGHDHGHKSKFVFIGSRLSLTGQNADEWFPINPGSEAAVALAVASLIAAGGADAGPYRELLASQSVSEAASAAGIDAHAIEVLAEELVAAGPSVVFGPGTSGHHRGATAANLAVLILNYVAGNIGQTVHVPTQNAPHSSYGDLVGAAADLASGSYGVAIVAGPNPVYSLPASSGFTEAFQSAAFKVVVSTSMNETAALADLVLPDRHSLESWGDAQGHGVYSVRQPAMRPVPMFESKAFADIVLSVSSQLGQDLGAPDFRTYVENISRQWLAENAPDADFASTWQELLRTGFSTYEETTPDTTTLLSPETALSFDAPAIDGSGDYTLVVYPSPRFGDGSYSNWPWLQELPDSVTKVTWHSVVEMHPNTGEALDLRNGDMVRVTSDQGEVEAPVWLYPGIREGLVALAMGGGHTGFGQWADGNGVNAMTLLSSTTEEPSGTLALVSTRVSVEPTGEWRRLATTEGSDTQEDRGVAPAIALSALGHAAEDDHGDDGHGEHQELQAVGGFVPVPTEGRPEDYPPIGAERGTYAGEHPRWAMAIDLDKCTGCGACVTACQAENNVPWVGENQMMMGRDLHWMRIERYYETVDASHAGPVDVRFLPMLCQHCNNAPCEPVCPVFAAYHTHDGLNAQAYNRCVGTRYCANNCPYKLRVYNWYTYADNVPEPMNWQWNPDVTVRTNGIMEKCSFCVQRIREAGNRVALEGRELQDGDVVTACQSVCGADVIVFGDIKDPNSRISQAVENERTYRVLDALINTQPAVNYLKKVTFHDVESGGH